jgi:hypothetical protein
MQKMQPDHKISGGMQTIHRPLHGIQQIMCLLLTTDLSVVDLPFFVNGHVGRMKLEREKECVCVVGGHIYARLCPSPFMLKNTYC